MNNKNSFVTIAEQISLLNQNSVEIITKLNDIVQSDKSSVYVNFENTSGVTSSYYLPTVGKLQKDIDTLNNNFQRLIQTETNNTYVFDDKTVKKIYTVDLNTEPNKISNLDTVSTFVPKNNWFFESLMNPELTVAINLKDKIEINVNKVLSRRYIIKFSKNEDGSITTLGQSAINDFKSKFFDRNDFTIYDFENWLTNPANTGVEQNLIPTYDEQIFEFDYNELKEFGLFSVLKQEIDSNNKLWLYLDTLNYFINDKFKSKKLLAIGDDLILNIKNSASRYEIKEIDIASSEPKIRVERIEGYEPIPTTNNILKIYSDINYDKILKIGIGFDEYNVIFLKAINTDSNIISSEWSNGIAMYTNDLVYDDNRNVSISQYYLDNVYDYGNVLKEMVKKTIPSKVALKPDAPFLVQNNFKVVQTNKHLQSVNLDEIKKLHSEKENTKSKIDQIDKTIQLKVGEIKSVGSDNERSTISNDLSKLTLERNSLSQLMTSITKNITTLSTDISYKAEYSVRAFWDIPGAKIQKGYKKQETIQFEIYYRKSSKTGQENLTESFNTTLNDGSIKQGNFSNWIRYKTDKRSRIYDTINDTWTWKIEDISDANTPNINQLDISIKENEKIEIKILSISEIDDFVSDFSNTVTVEFPDELRNIVSDTDYIFKTASDDQLQINFEQTLESKGYNKHIGESYVKGELYVSHTDKTIITDFKDENNNFFILNDYLKFLTNRIIELENLILSTKGELTISLEYDTNVIRIDNNGNYNIVLNAQDFYTKVNSTKIKNIIYNKTYKLNIKNTGTKGDLSFLTSTYTPDSNIMEEYKLNSINNLTALLDNNNNLLRQDTGQWIYFYDQSNGQNTSLGYIDDNLDRTKISLEKTLISNNKSVGVSSGYTNDILVNLINHTAKVSNSYNQTRNSWEYGLPSYYYSPVITKIDTTTETGDIEYHFSNSSEYLDPLTYKPKNLFMSTVNVKVNNLNYLKTTNISQLILQPNFNKIIPINIFFKPIFSSDKKIENWNGYPGSETGNDSKNMITDNNILLTDVSKTPHIKSIKFWLNVDGINFNATLNFNIIPKK